LKKFFKKSLFFIKLSAITSVALLTPSNAESLRSVDYLLVAKAQFIPAAYILIEHQPFIMPVTLDNGGGDYYQTVSKLQNALISVKGARGEAVVFSCRFTAYKKNSRFISAERTTTWNCNGASKESSHELIAGSTYSEQIYLDDSSIGWNPKTEEGHISIDVAYI